MTVADETVELLELARRQRSYVRIRRDLPGADEVEGFVLATAPRWTLLANISEVDLDGYDAVRTSDIERVAVSVGREPLVVRGLKANGSWPPPEPASIAVGSVEAVLAMAAAHAPILQIELEEKDAGAAYLGRFAGLGDNGMWLLQISPHAEWDDEPEEFALEDITRVVFGGRYAEVLHTVGGVVPGRSG